MKNITIRNEYVLVGCQAGCTHREKDTQDVDKFYSKRNKANVKSITKHPHCSTIANRAEQRTEIYKRADAERDKLEKLGKHRKAIKTWRKIADEWTQSACQFFET